MNKQIEEMAKIIDQAQKQGWQRLREETRKFVQKNHNYSSKNDYDKAHKQTLAEIIAEELYNAGYCKVDKEKYKKYLATKSIETNLIEIEKDKSCKETALDILQKIAYEYEYAYCNRDTKWFEKICKEYNIDINLFY